MVVGRFKSHYCRGAIIGMMRTLFALFSSCLLMVVIGCTLGLPSRIQLVDGVVRPAKSVIIISPDGMDYARFNELLAAGKLPHVKNVFVDGGVGVEYAFSCLPTVTYANYSSLITGRYPGHHDIMSNLWFDRRTLRTYDYMTLATYRMVNDHLSAPTIYDILGDHFTVNIQCHTRRGVTHSIDNSRMFAWAWILGRYTLADNHVVDSFDDVSRAANQVGRWPGVIMTYYPGVDEVGHQYGPDSGEYSAALQNIDRVVGLITDAVGRIGLSECTYYVLVTDHGMPPVEPDRHFDLRRWLRKHHDLKILNAPLRRGMDANDYLERFEEIGSYDAFVSIGADRHAAIHLRGKQGWACRPRQEEVDAFVTATPALHEHPAVDCVLTRAGPDWIKVWSPRGSVIVERRGHADSAQYRLTQRQGIPLGYDGSSGSLARFVDAGWHSSREWLQATAETHHPDFVTQAVEMFDSPRTGDVMVFAAEGWDFSTTQKGAHGSCLARDMRIVMYFAGPDLPKGATVQYARLVDLAPTIIGLLDEADRLERVPFIDGISLATELKAAVPRAARNK